MIIFWTPCLELTWLGVTAWPSNKDPSNHFVIYWIIVPFYVLMKTKCLTVDNEDYFRIIWSDSNCSPVVLHCWVTLVGMRKAESGRSPKMAANTMMRARQFGSPVAPSVSFICQFAHSGLQTALSASKNRYMGWFIPNFSFKFNAQILNKCTVNLVCLYLKSSA